MEKIFVKNFADAQQLLRVDGRFVVQALQSAPVDMQLLGEPSVCAVLAAQFIADKIAYVYLHSFTICALGYRFLVCFSTTTKKKGERISSPNCGRGITSTKKDTNARQYANFCLLLSL